MAQEALNARHQRRIHAEPQDSEVFRNLAKEFHPLITKMLDNLDD